MEVIALQVWWNLASASVKPPQLRGIVKRAKLRGIAKVPDINPMKALEWACQGAREWKFRADGVRYRTGPLQGGKVGTNLAGLLCVSIQERGKGGKWSHGAPVRLNPTTKAWSTTSGALSPAQVDFCDYATRLLTHHDQAYIRAKVIQPSLDALGVVPLRRRSGGVYWVPNQHAEGLMRLRLAINSIPGATLYVARVVGDTDGTDALCASVAAHVYSELSGIAEEHEAWQLSKRKTRTDSSAGVYKCLKACRAIVGPFSSSMGDAAAGELIFKINEVKAETDRILAAEAK